VEDSPIETRSTYQTDVVVLNHNLQISVDEATTEVASEQTLALSGRAPSAQFVELRRGNRVLAASEVQGERWELSLQAGELGIGHSRIYVRAAFPDGRGARSQPLDVSVKAPRLVSAADTSAPETPGLLAIIHDAENHTRSVAVDKLAGRLRALESKAAPPVKVSLRGYLEVKQSGLYQLGLRTAGRIKVRLHDQVWIDKPGNMDKGEAFAAIGLEAGWHPLEIDLYPVRGKPWLRALLVGETAPALLDAANLGHNVRPSPE
jgi:hypothetical protein